jgi:hypothetical protein
VIPWGGRFPQKGGSLVKINSFKNERKIGDNYYGDGKT